MERKGHAKGGAATRRKEEAADASERPVGDENRRVNVLVRIRPLSRTECSQQMVATPGVNDTTVVVKAVGEERQRVFSFDRVLGPGATQEEVFQFALPALQTVLNGCNGTVIAYGQTGAGEGVHVTSRCSMRASP